MKEKKLICKARSKKNGIVFHSNTFPLVGSETFRDDSGTIHSRIIPVNLDEYIDTIEFLNDKCKVIVFDIILISICLLSRNFWFVLASIYFSILVSFDLFEFAKIVYQMKSKNGKERSTARFHAAEHMVINAYHKLQRIPTFAEVKESSRFSNDCGSMEILYKISIHTSSSLTMAFVAGWNSLLYILLTIFIAIFISIADYKGWLKFLQIFITTIPFDSEIELAIEGIKNFEKMEKELNNKNGGDIIITLPSDFPPPFLF